MTRINLGSTLGLVHLGFAQKWVSGHHDRDRLVLKYLAAFLLSPEAEQEAGTSDYLSIGYP